MLKRHLLRADEYHLVDIMTGESYGGFISLDAARNRRS